MTTMTAGTAAEAPLFPCVTRDDVFHLATRRLWLRWPRLADGPALEAVAGLKQVAEMTGSTPHPLPRGESERMIFDARKANATGRSLVLALSPRSRPAQFLGMIAVEPARAGEGSGEGSIGELELGYMLHPDHAGQGLMAEAAQAVIDAVFTFTAIETIGAWTRVINPASRRVLEKCGFAALGGAMRHLPARGGMQPVDLFLLQRRSWAISTGWRLAPPAPASVEGAEGPSAARLCG